MKNQTMWQELTIGVAGIITVLIVVPFAAAQSTVSVTIGPPPPPDVCQNIDGIQAEVPDGMNVDSNGNCTTPTPPPTDVCANIDGLQLTIPSGYFQDTNGNCFPQPTPPVDVCPNLFGLQVVVPSSLIIDSLGNCVTRPVDECPNIAGDQTTIPAGMVLRNGQCITPAGTISPPDYQPPTPTTPTPTPTTPEPATPQPPIPPRTPVTPPAGSTTRYYTPPATAEVPRPYRQIIIEGQDGSTYYGGTDYQNIPEPLDRAVDPIIQAIPAPIKTALQSVSPNVARTVPYYVFGVLGMMVLTLVAQAIVELRTAKSLATIVKRDQNIAEQKDNFIALASHYLRTPLTLMRNGLDTIVALKELPAQNVQRLRSTVSTLDFNIKDILSDVENSEALKEINTPSIANSKPNILRSGFFWGPIISTAVLTIAANFFLGVVGNVELGTLNMVFQAVIFVATTTMLYSAVRNIFIRRVQKERQEQLLTHEQIVDEARNAFIQRSTAVLHKGLTSLYNHRPDINGAPSTRFFDEGYKRFLEILEKFLLLGTIQTGTTRPTEHLNLHDFVDEVTQTFAKQIDDKHLSLVNKIPTNIFVQQNRALYTFVIQSLIDNAIKFNKDSGTIEITANPGQHSLRVSVTDEGIGIPEDKVPQLFKPFTRADSAIEFNYEGLGFSLFLDKIITDYMGGSIKVTSPSRGGTSVSVTSPLATKAS